MERIDVLDRKSLVSICIPTYNRPDLLREALESCFTQTYQDYEIVIGDDSKNDLSLRLVEKFQIRYPKKIRYFRNVPSLGQAGNVNSLFENANGYRLVLIHDDDLLLPNALQDLSDCWIQKPTLTAAFGKQYEMSADGKIFLSRPSERYRMYGKIKSKAGLLKVPAEAGLLQMFPNNGFMVTTREARRIGYRSHELVGDACDYDFGLRLCLDAREVYFLDAFVSTYRFTEEAINKQAKPNPDVYKMLTEAKIPSDARPAYLEAMKFFAPRAVVECTQTGQGLFALRILFSKNYPPGERFSLKFLFYCLLVVIALSVGTRGVEFIFMIRKKFTQTEENIAASDSI